MVFELICQFVVRKLSRRYLYCTYAHCGNWKQSYFYFEHNGLICFAENGKKILQETITDEIEKMSIGPNELVKNHSLELLRILKG